MLKILQTVLLIFLIWISSCYSARGLNLPVVWWLLAVIAIVLQVIEPKKKK